MTDELDSGTSREPWAEYKICRECADIGADVRGNDGWMRHEDCAIEKNDWPHIVSAGINEFLGGGVTVYEGGAITVTGHLRHITTRLGVLQLADRLAERGVDYETLHPTREFLANGEDPKEVTA